MNEHSASAPRARTHRLDAAIAVFGAGLAILHLIQNEFFLFPGGQFKAIHLCTCLALVLACHARQSANTYRPFFLVLAAMPAVVLVYIVLSYDALIAERIFGPNIYDIGITLVLLAVTLTATACQWGITLPLIAVAAILYAYFGNYFPGDLFFHSGIGFERLTSYLAIPSFGGMLGSLTALSATLVFVFMIFAGVLKASGGIRFVLAIGRAVAGRSPSGPALIAIFGSGFMGMMSGSTVANVASTGAITIPLMKKSGFRSHDAGAIEAVASTGGQFTPPVMGLTAFLIIGITGISYNKIMLAAVVPAIVYYAYLIAAVHFRALGQGISPAKPDSGDPDGADITVAEAVRQYGHLLFSIGLLVFLLVRRVPPAAAALYATLLLVVLEAVKQAIVQRHDLPSALQATLKTVFQGLREGAVLGAQLAIIMATIGILIDILVTTGFAQKLAFAILNLADGELWLLLGLTALACLIFGLGMPTPAAYVLVALLGAPALVSAGIPKLHAHMFVFYFANMSAITPPVAVAALVASKIADAPYFRTALAALQLGLAGFILPFMFVLYPEILIADGSFAIQVLYAFSVLFAAILLNATVTGYFAWRLSPWERMAALAAAVIFLLMNVYGAAVATAITGALALLRARRS